MVSKRSAIFLGTVCSFLFSGVAIGDVWEPGPVAWWKFDEGGGTVAVDSVGSHHGTLMDDPNWSSGVDGMALVFDTLVDGVKVGHDSDLNPGTGPFTLAGWILNENTVGSAFKRIITKRGYASTWYSLYLNGFKVAMELAENYPSVHSIYSGGPAIQGDGLWHHVAGVRDDSGDVYFYIDGVQYFAGTSGHNLSNSEMLEIGSWRNETYGGESYKGQMDEVRIYNRALSEAEIEDVMLGVEITDPRSPNPANGATDVSVDPNLTWVRGDYSAQEEVYFGTDPCALPLADTIPSSLPAEYNPGDPDLFTSTTYYWQVISTDANGVEHDGAVWSFTTASGKATVDYPADGSLIAGEEYTSNNETWIHTSLDFFPGASAVDFRCYFSEDYDDVLNRVEDANLGPPPYSAMPHRYYAGLPFPGLPYQDTLELDKIYYWAVDCIDAKGNNFAGDVWGFGIQVMRASFPDPPDGAMFTPTELSISWVPGYCPPPGWPSGTILEHDVYLGTDFEDVNNAVYDPFSPPPEYMGFVMEPNFMVTDLSTNTMYYWRVDEVWGRLPPPLPGGHYYKGDVWSFTTMPADLNDDGSINFLDYAIFANDWRQTGPGFEGDIRKDDVVDYKDLKILLKGWLWKK